MKKQDIRNAYTQKVTELLNQGYTIFPDTMNGSQGEIAHIDLTNGSEIIRVLLCRGHHWKRGEENWPVHMSDGSEISGMIYLMNMIFASRRPPRATTRASKTPTAAGPALSNQHHPEARAGEKPAAGHTLVRQHLDNTCRRDTRIQPLSNQEGGFHRLWAAFKSAPCLAHVRAVSPGRVLPRPLPQSPRQGKLRRHGKRKAASAWLNRFQIRRGLLRFGQVVCGDLHRIVVLPEPDHDLTVGHRIQRLERLLPDLCQAWTFLHRRDPQGFEICARLPLLEDPDQSRHMLGLDGLQCFFAGHGFEICCAFAFPEERPALSGSGFRMKSSIASAVPQSSHT